MSSGPNAPLVDALCEFLEAAVHAVLRARGLYPPELFERARLYGVAVSKARHPGLCGYIASTISHIKPLLAAESLRELAVAFAAPDGAPLSKVTFIVQGVAPTLIDLDPDALEAAFRSALLKLQFIDNLLAPLPQGATFELLVLAASREGADPAFWTEEDPTEAAALDPPVAATPVKAVALEGVLSMQVLLEEGSSSGAEAAAEAAAGTEQG
ncbi:Mitotic spindle assembly checkpoint protein MAD2B [Monoraphidium neglectum]|uniref:Mitotic spindle assembly checkpoint protein MAD2B n=1 Tax=Monoraphidium neglectum TaxID=145388 RepID=A0A0D2MHS7_9CHLO|nr:Mitotic spindle assembly checkpoint protein MAD2B [Monoraphidium neglectum]KIZ00227.1 Mitotic spindle assembly checkpoint protein MAD2B [Monoraphidium neglectum]|eukprot:XP_013899246.1 Mitotic spindle assembly checkpoint protein MAD2B [Monoraphidium neglectum]